MKRLTLALLLCLCLSLTACGGPQAERTPAADPPPATEADPLRAETPEAPAETPAPYRLEIDGLDEEGRLSLAIVNDTGEEAQVLLIPTLERETAEGWTTVPFRAKIGFCGTPDPLPTGEKNWSEDTIILWGELVPGSYRLSYTVTDSAGTEHIASGTFTVEALELCAYPTAP